MSVRSWRREEIPKERVAIKSPTSDRSWQKLVDLYPIKAQCGARLA
jgi:hypothetical protein